MASNGSEYISGKSESQSELVLVVLEKIKSFGQESNTVSDMQDDREKYDIYLIIDIE